MTKSVAAPGEQLVLDVCCGPKMFWFDKNDSRAVYVDKREGLFIAYDPSHGGERRANVNPTVVADFTDLPFADESFTHVVFDPPHFPHNGRNSIMATLYGSLGPDWRVELRLAFKECFRVLKPGGTLVFKWNEVRIPVADILLLTEYKPLYGNRGGRQLKTHWIVFIK